MPIDTEDLIFTIALIVIVIGVFIAAIALVISFKKDDRLCCLGGGMALGVLSSSLGYLVWTAVQESGSDFEDIFTVISILILIIITVFASAFTLISTIKKKEFCCLGGGVALAGIGLGTGVILSIFLELDVTNFDQILIIVLGILLLIILITSFFVIVISLKKSQSLCCFAGALALVGVGLGISTLILFNDQFIVGVLILIISIILLGGLALISTFVKNDKK
ncbi:hypothetical protein WAK64_14005 [Bacillus spongiae]|uniref:DUF4203 domain-containing protein n=1 Tax=Bacillus spongiae TaxID=2683610 RepID=A0ABU8HGI3_9BACI